MKTTREDLGFFPLGELPFDTYALITDPDKLYFHCVKFVPTRWDEDLKQGTIRVLVYWYPVYAPKLFQLASQGLEFRYFLAFYHEDLPRNFQRAFPSTTKALDSLKEGKIKLNHMEETKLKT